MLALAACGSGTPLKTATEMPGTPRQPDGVVLEPEQAMPDLVDRAPATGIVALREPIAESDIEDVVRAYVSAMEREDLDALVQLLAEDASPLGRDGGRAQLVELWKAKIKSAEHQRLTTSELSEVSRIERHTYEALGGPDAPTRPPSMRPGDLYVRIPLAVSRSEQRSPLGAVLVFLLRREGGRLRIAGQGDETDG
jgi:hypothetical protein